jgi:integrase/recombinase XerD
MALAVADTAGMTLAAVGERYRHYAMTVRCLSAGTVNMGFIYLRRLFAFLGPPQSAAELFSGLDSKTIDAFLVDYARRRSPESRKRMHATLRAFLRFAWMERFLPQDLSALVPTVRDRSGTRLPKALPESAIATLNRSLAPDSPDGRRDAAMVCLLATYGVRGAQIRRLRLEHIDWERDRILFLACKGGRSVEQHLSAEAGNRLAEYITGGRPESCCREVFLDAVTGQALACPSTLSKILRRRFRQAQVCVPANVSHGTHGFRHAFAVRMVGRVPLKDLADMLGHRSPSSTLVYSKVDTGTLQQAALPWPGGAA